MYQITPDATQVIRISDGATIPFAEGNRDYADFVAWVLEGNQPEPFIVAEDAIAPEATGEENANIVV